MTKSPLILALALLALPACQSTMDQALLQEQDEQLTALNAERSKQMAQLSRLQNENRTLADQIAFEQQRNSELQQRVAAQDAAISARDKETDRLNTALEGTNIEVSRRGGHIVFAVPTELTFGSGKADLNKAGKDALTRVADILKNEYPGKTYWIEGHTDNEQPKKSGWKNNLELSANRAMSVANFLTADLAMDATTVRIAGYGEFAPKAPNDTPEGRATNRRVEILILD
jgi:chemotaxis protein MotB